MAISNPLSNLFGKSPIKPMQEHMTVVVEGTALLEQFMAAAIDDDWQAAEAVYNRIRENEEHADDLKQALRQQMPSGLFMPVSRGDLLELLSIQDHIINRAKDIAGLMLGRKMRIPPDLQAQMTEFMLAALAVARQALTAINELDELLETGFRGKEVDFVEELIELLGCKETKTDDLEREIRLKLMQIENNLPPVEVMFLYNIIEKIGGLADRAERVGGRLQLLLAR